MLSSVLDHLKSFEPADTNQGVLRDSYRDAVLAAGEGMLWKDSSEHVTASCFLFTPDLEQILLTYHRKGQFWVQFGGHLEKSDVSLDASAVREAREESGINDLHLHPGIADLDLHRLHGGFSCTAHWDIGFCAVADPSARYRVSDESEAVGWWPVTALPDRATDDLPSRIARVLAMMKATRRGTRIP